MMKKVLQFSFLLALIFCVSTIDSYGQRGSKKKDVDQYFDESGGFKHRLWYGGGFNLGFSGNGFRNQFNLGISPMVGYKIIENLSVGPRVSISYFNIRQDNGGGQIVKDNFVIYSFGAFTRYKVFNTFFAHVEYENMRYPDQAVWEYDSQCQRVGFLRSEDNFYAGLGYNSGGIFAYEFYALYNFNANDCTTDFPIEIRAGFTYKF